MLLGGEGRLSEAFRAGLFFEIDKAAKRILFRLPAKLSLSMIVWTVSG